MKFCCLKIILLWSFLFTIYLYRQQLQEQAKLVVEENALLMEQQEIQDKKVKEMQRIHGQEGLLIVCPPVNMYHASCNI